MAQTDFIMMTIASSMLMYIERADAAHFNVQRVRTTMFCQQLGIGR
jgi:hypothetical protein